MLIAIITFLLFSDSNFELLDYIADKEKNIASVVVNETRKQSALDITKIMRQNAKDYREQRTDSVKKMKKLLKRDGDQDLIDELLANHLDDYNQYNHGMLDLRFKLKEQLTEDEWARVFPMVKP